MNVAFGKIKIVGCKPWQRNRQMLSLAGQQCDYEEEVRAQSEAYWQNVSEQTLQKIFALKLPMDAGIALPRGLHVHAVVRLLIASGGDERYFQLFKGWIR